MQLLLAILSLTLLLFLLYYHWHRRYIYLLASKLPGPPALPLIGNGLSLMCKPEDILNIITKMTSPYSKPLRIWFGPVLIVFFSAPQHIEKILSSSKLAYKHDVYEILKVFIGDGLVSSLGGEKYKKHRKLIQPLFDLKFVTGNMEVFQQHINVLIKRLDAYVDKGTFDIHDLIHECFIDIIGETVLGTKMDAQMGKNVDYIKATEDMYHVVYARLMRPWLHPNIIYNCTSGKKNQDHIVNITTKFIGEVIKKSWSRVKIRKEADNGSRVPIIDQIAEIIKKNPKWMNDEDFLYHMYTLYLASEDTLTVIIAVLCVCFGMYPEYQEKAAEEIREVFGETPREVTYDDIPKLQYLDMCVKDVLRLIPIAPIIVRKTVEEFHIDKWVIPKDCGIMISIFDVHRDPNYWENPFHFHPDHFLSEAVKKRHPFAYVPFSAGQRSCVGKVLAYAALRLIMASILQRFKFEADGKFPDIPLRADISVRIQSGYKVRLKKRVWK